MGVDGEDGYVHGGGRKREYIYKRVEERHT
jgi:hypothetical protein